MTASSLISGNPSCFQFKAGFMPCTIFQLSRYDLDSLETQLMGTIKRAPQFLFEAPLLIDLEKVKSLGELDFRKIKTILLKFNLIPIGVRNGSEVQNQAASLQGLPVISVGKFNSTEVSQKKATEATCATKMVTTPIRSGMQVYAKDSDLIVTVPVSAGAEVLSDGNIHIYGPLRGRALAGVQGNTQARIFCRSLDAELVSIAGYYLTKEEMQSLPETHGMIQIYLHEDQVRIAAI